MNEKRFSGYFPIYIQTPLLNCCLNKFLNKKLPLIDSLHDCLLFHSLETIVRWPFEEQSFSSLKTNGILFYSVHKKLINRVNYFFRGQVSLQEKKRIPLRENWTARIVYKFLVTLNQHERESQRRKIVSNAFSTFFCYRLFLPRTSSPVRTVSNLEIRFRGESKQVILGRGRDHRVALKRSHLVVPGIRPGRLLNSWTEVML